MQVNLIKNYKYLNKLSSIILPHLPKFLWNAYFSPLTCFFTPNSSLQKKLKKSKRHSIPRDYFIEQSITVNKPEIIHFIPDKNEEETILHDVYILKNGSIISNEAILCESSLFQKISFDRLIRDSSSYFSSKKQFIPEATFIPRQLIDHGTYGYYFAEFLIPFCCHQIKKENTLLIDADFIEKYAKLDLETIGYHNSIRIPAGGVRVKKLTIKLPVQFFDNFMSQNLLKLKEMFPVENPSYKNKKVYISRVGFEPDFANKNQRKIINEVEVEQYLRSAGFYILRSHEQNNKDCRSILKAAEIIVFNHGSGFINAAWSTPTKVIELASEEWWNPYFLKLCVAMDVKKYSVIKTQNNKISLEKLADELKDVQNR
jgi:hypothetical protein